MGGLPLSKKAQEMNNLSVLCALRQSCVMLTPDTSLVEALEVSHLSRSAAPTATGLGAERPGCNMRCNKVPAPDRHGVGSCMQYTL